MDKNSANINNSKFPNLLLIGLVLFIFNTSTGFVSTVSSFLKSDNFVCFENLEEETEKETEKELEEEFEFKLLVDSDQQNSFQDLRDKELSKKISYLSKNLTIVTIEIYTPPPEFL